MGVFRILQLTAMTALLFIMSPLANSDSNSGTEILMRDEFLTADPETMKWERNRSAPWGMRIIVLYGDPSKPGPYIFRVKMPSAYVLPPHRHKDDRTVTVLKGSYWIGTGEEFNRMDMQIAEAGAFYTTKADVPHYAWARTEVILQESGYGPTDMRYVHPEDDPRNQ